MDVISVNKKTNIASDKEEPDPGQDHYSCILQPLHTCRNSNDPLHTHTSSPIGIRSLDSRVQMITTRIQYYIYTWVIYNYQICPHPHSDTNYEKMYARHLEDTTNENIPVDWSYAAI